MPPGSVMVRNSLLACRAAWPPGPCWPCLAGPNDRARQHAGVVFRGLGTALRHRRHRGRASTRSRAALTWHRGRFADECLSSSHVARLAVRRSGVISLELTETSRVPPQAGPEYCGYSHVLKPMLRARELRGPRYDTHDRLASQCLLPGCATSAKFFAKIRMADVVRHGGAWIGGWLNLARGEWVARRAWPSQPSCGVWELLLARPSPDASPQRTFPAELAAR